MGNIEEVLMGRQSNTIKGMIPDPVMWKSMMKETEGVKAEKPWKAKIYQFLS